MLKTVKQACKFNPIIRDYRMSEGIENLSSLISDEGDGREFFAHNYITSGMEQIFREGMLRLDGKSDQAVFELAQAMGGGKTHMMIALGLLARHPELRGEVLPASLMSNIEVGEVRVAAFNGRNNPENYIWGEIASQLGEDEAIKPYWVNGPRAVDQAAWKKIIGDKPTLIMLDELPPYLENASTTVIGHGTLATVTTYTLACLMSAALELPRCCIVIANLSGSYVAQTKLIADAISNLQQEARRQAKTITPVQLAGNEIYEILKKRLLLETPDESVINEVAEEYAQRIKAAADGGYVVASSLEHVTQQVSETYPFHPSFKHLVALFKENEGFRQTRGLMQFAARLLKSVADRELDDVYLIGAQHLNLNDDSVRDEIGRIANSLRPAMTHDLADNQRSIAEEIDNQLGTDAAQQVGALLLASSLSRSVGGRIGLTEAEIIEFLAAPNRKPDEFMTALEKLREHAWYLHREEQRYYIKETENLSRQIERNARDVPQPKIDQALINKLIGLLQPVSKAAYQEVQVLPKLDDLKLSGPRVLMVVRPDGKLPPSVLANFFNFQAEKNNFLVLSGHDSYLADVVEERLRDLYAIEAICRRLREGDSLFEEARDRFEDAQQRFNKALSGAYNRLYFPSLDELDGREKLMMATIDNGLNMGVGAQSAEQQIEQLLASPRANYKLVLNLSGGIGDHWAMAEVELWPERDRRTPWKDVLMRAKSNPGWTWMPGAGGMDALKAEALKQGRWRQGADGYVEKGPFPAEKTSVNVTVQNANAETGETLLTLTPRNAGPSPVVHYAPTSKVGVRDPKVEDLDNFGTTEATLYFLAVDMEGKYEAGEPQRWTAELRVRHQVQAVADHRMVTLQCTPAADMRYTLDGVNPKDGVQYDKPFEVGSSAIHLMVYASAGEASRTAEFPIPAAGDKKVQIDDTKPARLSEGKRVSLDSTDKVFGILNTFKSQPKTTFKGVSIQIGEGEHTVSVRFQEREITAATIESAINGLRKALGDEQEAVTVQIKSGATFDNPPASEYLSLQYNR
ncbi:DUF499 domain-containing protein [Paraburkholderia sp. 1N]|uniref:DUF499 domain-containing protein n=1 Tax=Paraburkholderia solitsugae TaxID=2675748 RepID=A0ABX2BK42_9BURK|nr:anti-phage-associated DUF499 domain-containing protein [Paraburkholderia solitsugae]NPT41009.1 DUF499 domain-containing protein [Paraburkholderia solitsugae]